MRVALYVRVSTNRQQQAQTIEQQVTQRHSYVAAHDGAAVAEPRGSPLERAVEAIGVAAVAAARRLGPHTGPFEFASGASGGRLLCNTNAPFPAPW
jgi:hypothetical protein